MSKNENPDATVKLRFGSNENLIRDAVCTLAKTHKLGDLVADLLRVWYGSPESLESRQAFVEAVKIREISGIDARYTRFQLEAKRILSDVFRQSNEIYSMTLNMYCSASLSETVGLKKRVENLERAQFMIQKQVKDLCKVLEIDTMSEFESSKAPNFEQISEDVLEYTIEKFESIVNGMKSDLQFVESNANRFSNYSNNNSATASNNVAKPRVSDHADKQSNKSSAEAREEVKKILGNDTIDIDGGEIVLDDGSSDNMEFEALSNFFGVG